MNIEHLKPIPEYIKRIIDRRDEQYMVYSNSTRYYAYLTTVDDDLVKVTVAVKMNDIRERLYKQVTVHCLHDQNAYAKDIARGYICGYVTGWSYEGLNKRFHFFEDREWGYDPKGGFDLFACIVNMGYLRRTRYKYSGAIEYGGYDVLAYLRAWEQYPKVELLAKIGLARLAFRKSILKKAMKDKNFLRWIVAHTDDIKQSNGNANNILFAYNHGMSVCDADLIRFYVGSREFDKPYIKQVIPESEYIQLVNYLRQQNAKPSVYEDYLKACVYLGLDMTQNKNRYPHDLNRWHDIRTLEYSSKKADDEEEQHNRITAGIASMAIKYAFMESGNDDYVIYIAKNRKELRIEGEYLSHCVGRMGYDAKIADGKSLIFFLRKKDEPTIPFVTIEYDLKNMRIAQYHGKNNSTPDIAVLDYINKTWVPMVAKQLKKVA